MALLPFLVLLLYGCGGGVQSKKASSKCLGRSFFTLPLDGGGQGWG